MPRALRAPLSSALVSARSLLVTIATAAAASAFVSCGGDEESGPETAPAGAAAEPSGSTAETATAGGGQSGGEAERIEAAVAAALISAKASEACDEAVTPGFVERAYGDRRGCAAALDPAARAEAAEVRDLEISPDAAIAVIRPIGGVYDGERLEVTLVREGDAWRVDRLEADVAVGP